MTDPKQIPDISLEDISFLLSLARSKIGEKPLRVRLDRHGDVRRAVIEAADRVP